MKSELINSLNISPDARKIIEEYLEELNIFIKKHNLDKELYSDLEERLYEKLSEEKNITKIKVLKAIYEIGEPSEIFGVEDSESLLDKINADKITENSLNIAKKTGNKLASLINFLYNFALNILIKAKNITLNIIKKIWGIIVRIWNNFMSSDNVLLNFFIKAVAFCYSSLGIIIFLIGIFGIGLIPVQFLNITIDNLVYTESMDVFLKIGLSFLAFATTALGVIVYKRKLSKVPSLLAVGLLFTFAFSLGIVGGFNTVQNFMYKTEKTQEIIIPLEKNQKEFILNNFELYGNEYFIFDGEFENYNINFRKLENNQEELKNFIKIEISNTINTKDNIAAENFFKNLNNIKYKLNGNKINLYRENNSTFKNPIAFTPLMRKVTIFLPEDISIKNDLWKYNSRRYGPRINTSSTGDYVNKYGNNHYYNSCSNGIIKYKKDYQEFVCDLTDKDKKYLEEERENNTEKVEEG
ncbi:MAG: hypothetical protein N4A38_01695 [Candidatus Gracilibacteria bacterium]|nr:hypothetical protein [Candidatus Gracilibacteria bacterium]